MVEQPSAGEQPLKVSTPKEIKELSKKRAVGDLLEFPSGFTARLCRPGLAKMIKSGTIPQELLAAAMSVSSGVSAVKPADIGKMMDVMEIMCIAAFMEPKLVKENPSENEISFSDLTDEDRAFVFSYVQQGVGGLKNFRSPDFGKEDKQ